MFILLTLGAASAAQDPADAKILPIEPGWAATKVNTGIFRHHAVLTHDGRQFVGYYDPEGHVTIASRDLPSETWTLHRTDFKGNVKDAHNGISLGVSSDGLLHLSYDHHGHPLRYRRSAAPGDPTSFGPIVPMTGRREQRVTYPQFVNLADGTLLFFYRDGGSGRGDVCINRYDVESGKWEVLQHPVISGGGEYNAYWCRPAVGSDGSLQLAWCWRRTGNAATNSRICYARSPDGGVNWENSRGERYPMPISPENAEIVDPVEENNNLSNQDSSEVDSQNRMHIVVRMNDGAEIPQYFHIWWDGSRWRKSQVSRFTEVYQLKGGGTLRTPLSRADLFIDTADRVYVLYRDNRLGSPPMVAQASPPDYDVWTHSSLADVNLRQWEPNYDIGRWKREGVLNLFIQSTDQGNHETATATGPQMVSILEWRPVQLPRVLLIGDSICLGYGEHTKRLLSGKADVHCLPTNGGPTIRGLEHLDEWLGTDHWDVIHFNWGLHDLRFMQNGKHQVPLDEYEKNLTELVRRLKRRGAKLIWASTTPVPDAKVSPPRKNSDVIAYNAAARRIAEQNGIAVNDLYAFALPRLAELQRPANVHFTEAGSAALAERVAASILEALGSPAGGTHAAPTAKRCFAHVARQDH